MLEMLFYSVYMAYRIY